METATLLAAKMNDMESFDRHISQLKPYYQPKASKIPESELKNQILGLNLLRLLAENKIADFHTELELIPTELLDQVHFKVPIQLEQFLMEGAFNKIIAFCKAPDCINDSNRFVLDRLAQTVREEIADCSEKAFQHLNVDQAVKLFLFPGKDDLFKFIESVCFSFHYFSIIIFIYLRSSLW